MIQKVSFGNMWHVPRGRRGKRRGRIVRTHMFGD